MFTLEELRKATDAVILGEFLPKGSLFEISTDTRKISGKNVYIPLQGENFDGEYFIEDAISKGVEVVFSRHNKKFENAVVLYVKDTKIAYLKLAKFYREKINPKVVCITGSCGKTTVKEMVACVLSEKFKVHKTSLNHNNEIGFCQTVLSMKNDVDILVVEAGMRALGEIDLIASYAMPDIAIITNVGSAHIGRLLTKDNIAKAKCEILNYLKVGSVAIVEDNALIDKNLPKNLISDIIKVSKESQELKIISQEIGKTVFDYKNKKYTINIEGIYNVMNAVFAIETGFLFGCSTSEIKKGLLKFSPVGKRWQVEKINDLTIINDSYNANPESMEKAIETFLNIYKGKNILVLGDMGELGEKEIDYHKNLGKFLNGCNFSQLITVGSLAKNINSELLNKNNIHFDDKIECAEYIMHNIKNAALFFKASRSMKFEEIIERLKRER